ncbi:hypothetical protein CCM_09536 [Cordyceps militaris CM01]|uniref:Uncharacterized protein n=1 Tax=Cordyceps militaris (strain CM01) TaxID=983644 RepID=G3JUD9_CORMM|nr:uncharacterized protein CCM_09536 [Cordyceps militaris CM01]EGX87913.1 hypothetical protein CCM_09536 [Cordyceps militaris CM01]
MWEVSRGNMGKVLHTRLGAAAHTMNSHIQNSNSTCVCTAPSPSFLPMPIEIRAAQRTFEGAYMRTALGQFSFSLVILKIFTHEFYPIGALFAVYGTAILMVAVYRRYEGQRQFFTKESADGLLTRKFRTSGDTVTLMTILSLLAYATLLVLTLLLTKD